MIFSKKNSKSIAAFYSAVSWCLLVLSVSACGPDSSSLMNDDYVNIKMEEARFAVDSNVLQVISKTAVDKSVLDAINEKLKTVLKKYEPNKDIAIKSWSATPASNTVKLAVQPTNFLVSDVTKPEKFSKGYKNTLLATSKLGEPDDEGIYKVKGSSGFANVYDYKPKYVSGQYIVDPNHPDLQQPLQELIKESDYKRLITDTQFCQELNGKRVRTSSNILKKKANNAEMVYLGGPHMGYRMAGYFSEFYIRDVVSGIVSKNTWRKRINRGKNWPPLFKFLYPVTAVYEVKNTMMTSFPVTFGYGDWRSHQAGCVGDIELVSTDPVSESPFMEAVNLAPTKEWSKVRVAMDRILQSTMQPALQQISKLESKRLLREKEVKLLAEQNQIMRERLEFEKEQALNMNNSMNGTGGRD